MVTIIDKHEVTIRPVAWEERYQSPEAAKRSVFSRDRHPAIFNVRWVRGWEATCTCGEPERRDESLPRLTEWAEAHEAGMAPACEGGYR